MYIGIVGNGDAPSERVVELVLQDALGWPTNDDCLVVCPRDVETLGMNWARQWATDRQISTSVSTSDRVLEMVIEKRGTLLVFWDPANTELHAQVERALCEDLDVYDVCNPGTRIAPLLTERKNMPKLEKSKVYGKTELESLALTEDGQMKLATIAGEYGIDAEAPQYPEWEDVIKAVLAAQKGDDEDDEADLDTEESEVDSEESEAADEEEFTPYTEDDLKDILASANGVSTLKEILTDFGGEVPDGKPRGTTIIKLILEAQEEALSEVSDGSEPADDVEVDLDADEALDDEATAYDVLPIDEIVAAIEVTLDDKVKSLEEVLTAAIASAVDTAVAEIRQAIDEKRSASPVPQTNVRRLPARRR